MLALPTLEIVAHYFVVLQGKRDTRKEEEREEEESRRYNKIKEDVPVAPACLPSRVAVTARVGPVPFRSAPSRPALRWGSCGRKGRAEKVSAKEQQTHNNLLCPYGSDVIYARCAYHANNDNCRFWKDQSSLF